MSKYRDWQYLIERWGLREFDILAYFKHGLQPYRQNGVPFPCPKERNQAYLVRKEELDSAESRKEHFKELYFNCSDIDINEVISYFEKTYDTISDETLSRVNTAIHQFLDEEILRYRSRDEGYIKFIDPLDVQEEPGLETFLYMSEVKALKALKDEAINEYLPSIRLVETLTKRIEAIDWSSWDNFEMPLDESDTNELINYLQDALFRTEDIERVGTEYDLMDIAPEEQHPSQKETQVKDDISTEELIENDLSPEYKNAESLFFQTGAQSFFIRFNGQSFTATARRQIDGFIHIAELLQSKDPIKATDLYGAAIEEHSFDIIDSKAKGDIKNKFKEYKEDLAKLERESGKETPEYIALENDRDNYIKRIEESYKMPLKNLLMKNTPKEHSKNTKKLKDTVRRRIERAIKDISKSNKGIAKIFHDNITCSHECRYNHPAELPPWEIVLK